MRVDVELAPSFSSNEDKHRYIGTATMADAFRYVVGSLRQTTGRIALRTNYTFTPALSLESFVEAFTTSGRHESFHEVVAPGRRSAADRLRPIGAAAVRRENERLAIDLDADFVGDVDVAEPDFGRFSLRSTMVLRWEFRAGSALSLVVQQDGGRDSAGYRTLRDLARAGPASHEIRTMLKINYWFSL